MAWEKVVIIVIRFVQYFQQNKNGCYMYICTFSCVDEWNIWKTKHNFKFWQENSGTVIHSTFTTLKNRLKLARKQIIKINQVFVIKIE